MADGTLLGPPAFGWEITLILVAGFLVPVLAAASIGLVVEFCERRGKRG